MSKRIIITALGTLTLLAGAGAYAVADVYDQVPGVLTRVAPPSPAPVPTAAPLAPAPGVPTEEITNLEPITRADFEPALKKLVKDTDGARLAVYVVDAATGNVLVDKNSITPMQPASTTKVLTAFTAATHLDFSERLATRTFLAEDGAIHLTGEGDLLLAAGNGGTGVNGRAGLAELADQTVAALDGKKPSELIYHTERFGEPKQEKLSDDLLRWVGQVGPFAVNGGMFPGGNYEPYRDDPTGHAAEELVKLLDARGVDVTAKASEEAAPEGARMLGEVRSAPIGEVVHLALNRSDNTLTEQVCRLAAEAAGKETTLGAAAQNVTETIAEAGVFHDGLEIRDCSGLNEGNRIAPRTQVGLLEKMWGSDRPQYRQVMNYLPSAWFEGTLSKRFDGQKAAPRVSAKTGLLDHALALAGRATRADGRVLLFEVQVDSTEEPAWVYRDAIDEFAATLAGK